MVSPDNLFTEDFRAQPYWLQEGLPQVPMPDSLPRSIDVLVVGSGYTGLGAALQTVRGGRSTLVLDAGPAAGGCSSRNGGQVSHSIKPDLNWLARHAGTKTAQGIYREGSEALSYLEQFIIDEGFECDWERCGRFIGAHNAYQYRQLCKQARVRSELSQSMHIVTPERTGDEIGSSFYHGGAVNPDNASLHPGKYAAALLQRASGSGVQLRDHCEVLAIEKQKQGYSVTTTLGQLQARDIIVATNGYTGKLLPRLRARVIPIGSYMIATEILPGEMMDALMPTRRMLVDTRRLVVYYRACPQRQRILFGGRVALAETDPVRSAPWLHREMCRIFPALQQTRVSHAWMGFVGFTFDKLPHIGCLDGIHYAMGYCGSGVSLSSYFGMKIGRRLLGQPDGDTPLADVEFPTRPYYSGHPWFLAPTVFYYRLRDRLPR